MNAAKSAHLLMTGYNMEANGYKVAYIKPSVDTRDGNRISSRTGLEKECEMIDSNVDLAVYYNENHYEIGVTKEVLLIDECQFLTVPQVKSLLKLISQDIHPDLMVICYGLKSDCNMDPFPASAHLFAVASSIEELKSSCKCGKKALVNAKKDGVHARFKLALKAVDVGGDSKYEATCIHCWKKGLITL